MLFENDTNWMEVCFFVCVRERKKVIVLVIFKLISDTYTNKHKHYLSLPLWHTHTHFPSLSLTHTYTNTITYTYTHSKTKREEKRANKSSKRRPSTPSCELCSMIFHFSLVQGKVWIRIRLLKGSDVSQSSISSRPLVQQSTRRSFWTYK